MTSPMTRRGILALIVFLCLSATGLVSVSATAADPADRSESLSSKAAAKAATNKITYRGRGVEIARLSGNQRQLKGAPRAFKKYVVKRLDEMFTEAGSAKRCATAPTIVIKRFDARGFASGSEGSFGPCPSGGSAVIYKKSGSTWEPILSTQDVRYCQDLAFYDVNAFIAGRDCIDVDGQNVRYRLNQTAKNSPEATARRVARLVGGFPIVPSEAILTPAAEDQVAELSTTKGYVEVGACVAEGDPVPLADKLGGSDFGCEMTAWATTTREGAKESYVLRMDDDFVAKELFRLV